MKVVIILFDIKKSNGIEWMTSGLLNSQFNLYFILINDGDSEMEQFLIGNQIPVSRIFYNKKLFAPLLVFKIYFKILKIKPDIVHTHLRYADIYGQIAAFLCRVRKRIYTRHSSTFNHLYHKRSVIVDKFVNSLTTRIVAVSEVTREVLTELENVDKDKAVVIHHGFDLSSFSDVSEARINAVKHKYNIPDSKKVIGVIARYTEWKGYQYTIPAFSMLVKDFPDLHLILANGVGEFQPAIKEMLKDLPETSYTEIRFESDVQALYKIFDVYVHAPIDRSVEAFGQTYVEALAAGIPSVFTLSGVANEFIVHEENALVVGYQNTVDIFSAITRLLNSEDLRKKLIRGGRNSVKKFGLEPFIEKFNNLYSSQA